MLVGYATPGRRDLAMHGPILDVVATGPAGEVRTRALIDTGSSMSSVDADLLAEIGATSAGHREVWTITDTPMQVPAHAGVCISTVDGFHMCERVPLVLATGLQAPVLVLLGRDALRGLQFVYNGDSGEWYLARGDVLISRGTGGTSWGAIAAGAAAGGAAGLASTLVSWWLRQRSRQPPSGR